MDKLVPVVESSTLSKPAYIIVLRSKMLSYLSLGHVSSFQHLIALSKIVTLILS